VFVVGDMEVVIWQFGNNADNATLFSMKNSKVKRREVAVELGLF